MICVMDKPTAPPATEELARTPAFEDALHELVESGFGELHEASQPAPGPTPAPATSLTSWW